jgi:hypothetical protein
MKQRIYEIWISLPGDMHDTFIVKMNEDDENEVKQHLKGLKRRGYIEDSYVKTVDESAISMRDLRGEFENMGLI